MAEMKKIPTRDEIALEDKWALEDLYPTDEAWEQEAATLACQEERAWVEQREEEVLKALEEKGMTVDYDVDIEAFQGAVSSLIEDYKPQIGEELVTAVQEICAK